MTRRASRVLPAVARGRVALVGDASGTVDAVTGHGLSLSFQQAIHLAAGHEARRTWPIISSRTQKSPPCPLR